MPINSRNKGASAEREVAQILRDELGIETKRNLEQWRSGGSDILGVPGFAIEVKRAAKPLIAQWWAQTVSQAELVKELPCLWYRLDRRSWRVLLPLWAICADAHPSYDLEWTAEITPEAFCMIARERMNDSNHR
jgi:Holliday junction resolvase